MMGGMQIRPDYLTKLRGAKHKDGLPKQLINYNYSLLR